MKTITLGLGLAGVTALTAAGIFALVKGTKQFSSSTCCITDGCDDQNCQCVDGCPCGDKCNCTDCQCVNCGCEEQTKDLCQTADKTCACDPCVCDPCVCAESSTDGKSEKID